MPDNKPSPPLAIAMLTVFCAALVSVVAGAVAITAGYQVAGGILIAAAALIGAYLWRLARRLAT